MTERKPRTLTCRYHCAACGEHFTSLTAFDRHRAGEFTERRYCVPPRHVNADSEKGPRLAVQGVGECRLGGGDTITCEVWETA